MKRVALVLIVLFIFSIGGVALAQQQQPGAPSARPMDKLALAKMWKLTEVLNLDEQQAAKLFPVISKYDRMIGDKVKEKIEIGRKLKAHFDGREKLAPNDLAQLSRRLWVIDQEISGLQLERFNAVSKILTPEDAAKYSTFEMLFQEEVRNAMRRMHGPQVKPMMPPQGPPPDPMGPGPDSDD